MSANDLMEIETSKKYDETYNKMTGAGCFNSRNRDMRREMYENNLQKMQQNKTIQKGPDKSS